MLRFIFNVYPHLNLAYDMQSWINGTNKLYFYIYEWVSKHYWTRVTLKLSSLQVKHFIYQHHKNIRILTWKFNKSKSDCKLHSFITAVKEYASTIAVRHMVNNHQFDKYYQSLDDIKILNDCKSMKLLLHDRWKKDFNRQKPLRDLGIILVSWYLNRHYDENAIKNVFHIRWGTGPKID